MSRKDTALKYFNEQKELTDIRVKSGIELNRKGDADITLKMADGSALPENVTVEVEQVNHEFKFGASARRRTKSTARSSRRSSI